MNDVSESTKKAECDCLNWCGDDPQLKTGMVQACPAKLARQEQGRILDDRLEYVRKLCKIHGAAGWIDLVERLQAKLDERGFASTVFLHDADAVPVNTHQAEVHP